MRTALLTSTSLTICAATLVGCVGTPNSSVVPVPSQITLESAMASVGRGLRKMNSAAHPSGDPSSYGLLAHDVTVTFNVTAAQTGVNANKLVVDLNAAAPAVAAGVGVKVGGEATASQTLQTGRGNVIVVRFLNPAYAPMDTAAYAAATTQPIDPKMTSFGRMLDDIISRFIITK